ncbi:MAG: hypothetical protein LUH16_05145 [Clostridiales bacterium]|nr:hypothetical protein [Clostridiales bacterium]
MGIPTDYNTEHVVVGRIYEHKSQVDMTLAANTCREVYLNQVDSVILVSSDSDYWALIQSLPGIHFLVMLDEAFRSTWVQMSDKEKANFYDWHIKTMRLKFPQTVSFALWLGSDF